MEWFNSLELSKVANFVFGGGVVWILNYALNLRKQKKDEFVILRETWVAEDKKNKETIKKLELKIEELYSEIKQLKHDNRH